MTQNLRANSLLFLTAAIWGAAFVAQRAGMEHMGPHTFNAARFALGALTLSPLLFYLGRQETRQSPHPKMPFKALGPQGLLLGIPLFLGSYLQQFGLCYTTAGKAGFLTGLYVVFVPIFGTFFGQRYTLPTWAGAGLTILGMYFLSITKASGLSSGDSLVILSAIFWATHVLLVSKFTTSINSADAIRLATLQFLACAGLSTAGALLLESPSAAGIFDGLIPIAYGGICSVGIAYTLQLIAQRNAHPASAAIILSLEAVFAALAGWILLGETLTLRALFGCVLMLAGMILAQKST